VVANKSTYLPLPALKIGDLGWFLAPFEYISAASNSSYFRLLKPTLVFLKSEI
jgi:hypothetical protein